MHKYHHYYIILYPKRTPITKMFSVWNISVLVAVISSECNLYSTDQVSFGLHDLYNEYFVVELDLDSSYIVTPLTTK